MWAWIAHICSAVLERKLGSLAFSLCSFVHPSVLPSFLSFVHVYEYYMFMSECGCLGASYVWPCVHMCGYVCMCVTMCACLWELMWNQRLTLVSSLISTLFTVTRSLNSTRSSLVGPVGLVSSGHQESRLCLPCCGISGGLPHLPDNYMGSRGLKSDLHICTTNTLCAAPALLVITSLYSFLGYGPCQGGG